MSRSVAVQAKPKTDVRDCEGRGHHLHEPDGSVYVRHSERPLGEFVTVACCYCGATTEGMPVHSRLSAPPGEAAYSRKACGDALPVTKRFPSDVETRHAAKDQGGGQ